MSIHIWRRRLDKHDHVWENRTVQKPFVSYLAGSCLGVGANHERQACPLRFPGLPRPLHRWHSRSSFFCYLLFLYQSRCIHLRAGNSFQRQSTQSTSQAGAYPAYYPPDLEDRDSTTSMARYIPGLQGHDVRLVSLSVMLHPHVPDFELHSEYMLWTDASSREFIAEHYPWFLETFDNYRYSIQRADAIRYFVLYHYGGVYIDLDVGCLHPLDPLLKYPVVLPKTIPVGVSNDLMFAEKGHPFFKQTIENLERFDYSWVLNYPTVMFSTGPMFLSAQYSFYVAANPDTATTEIRILPKSLYGKNAKEHEAPHSFFSHFYGSSWHADDAAFISFLNTWGKSLMWLGCIILIFGLLRLPSKPRRSFPKIGGYDIVFPSLSRSGRWHFHLGRSSLSPSHSSSSSDSSSPIEGELPVLHIPLNVDSTRHTGRPFTPIADTFRHFRNRIRMVGSGSSPPHSPVTPSRPRRGVLFFLPAVFATHSPDIELQPASRPRSARRLSTSSAPDQLYSFPPGKQNRQRTDMESRLALDSDSRHSRFNWKDVDEYLPLYPTGGISPSPSHTRTSSTDTVVEEEEDPWFF